jgi:Fe-Mn family superoxide dismutase
MSTTHEPKNYDHLIGKVKGLSETQLKAHFGLYQGYVKKLNEIESQIASVDKTHPNYSFDLYSELRRREPVAYNGTYLHELYFDNLIADGDPSAELKKAVSDSFGSWDNWVQDFKANAGSAHGWVNLGWDHANKKVLNNLIHTEHHSGLMIGIAPLLTLDVWEHAYFFDFQTKKPDYLTAFFNNINWKVVNERFSKWSK